MSEPKWRGRSESSVSQVESNVRPYSSHDYSELPEPEEQQPRQLKQTAKKAPVQVTSEIQIVPEKVVLPVQSPYVLSNSASRLALGSFDEFESHSSFVEALNAWRAQPAQIVTKPIKAAEVQQKSLLAQKERQTSAKVERADQDLNHSKKQFCYQCFKLIQEAVVANSKQFCKEVCASTYASENLLRCQRKPPCSVSFSKGEGLPRLGKWFCSENCIELDYDVRVLTKSDQSQQVDS